jgi:hypothetical protein
VKNCGERIAAAAQALEVRGLDGVAEELHVAFDLDLVGARPVEMRLGVAVDAAQLLLDAGSGHVLVEAGGLDNQVLGRGVAHDFVAVGQALARDLAPHELLVEELAAFLEVHAVGHLSEQVGGADQAADHAVLGVVDADIVDLHLVAGEVHQAGGDWRFGAVAHARQVGGDEIGAAADMGLGEHRAVLHPGLGRTSEVARVVQQRDHHPEHGAARPDTVRRGAGAVVAIDQAREGERHVEGVAHVVVERVAREVAGEAAIEQRLKVGESALERCVLEAGIARAIEREHRVADPHRILDVDAIGHVILIETVLHRQGGSRRITPDSAARSLPLKVVRLFSAGGLKTREYGR